MFGLFGPKRYVATLEPGSRRLEVKRGQRLLDAALEAGLAWPHDCRVGSCGTCRCVLKGGRIKSLTDLHYTLAVDDVRTGAILACQTLLKSDVQVEVSLADNAATAERIAGRIAHSRPLTHDILELSVHLDAPAFRGFRGGQYFELMCDAVSSPRSYSAVHRVGDVELVFFIRHVPGGEFTDWLFGADRGGARLMVNGPYGQFYRRAGQGRMLCVAGGSGLAPINALLEEALADNVTRECIVLFGARSQRDVYWQAELSAIAARWPARFEYHTVLSSEAEDSGWPGARGMVTDVLDVVMRRRPPAAGDEAYLCGPPPMVDAGVARLKALGMAAEDIFFDRFFDASSMPGGR